MTLSELGRTLYAMGYSSQPHLDEMVRNHARGDDTTPCADCRSTYFERMGSYWLTDDALWAQIVRDNTIALCPGCFARRASAAGIPIHWRAVREGETPSDHTNTND